MVIARTIDHDGYPAYTETGHEFRAWIEREENRKYGRMTYRPIAFKPVVVSTTVNIQI